ncbi:unnamed protein product [Ectocarpus fasciculatus]
MPPKRSIGSAGSRGMSSRTGSSRGRSSRQEPRTAKRPRQQTQSALAWGDDDPDAGDSDSEDGDGGGGAGTALSKERKEVEEAKEQAEAEARETAEEKRLRLARDVLMKLDAEQRENREEGTDEEEDDAPGDYIGDRLAHARLEATGQLYREVAKGLQGQQISPTAVRHMRGHKLSPTCVVLSPDDTTAFSGSKDNSIIRWDVETGKRVTMLPHWRKLPGGKVPSVKAHSKEVLTLAVSGDGRYLASGGRDRLINVWDCRTDTVVETFRGHQDTVSSLAFRANSLALFSGSHDRCVKHWDLNEMGYVETMFGHQSEINAIDSWRKERLVTGGRDRTVRLWKVLEDSHLVFRPVGGGSIDCVRMLNEDWFTTGGEDGSLALWFAMKKKPAVLVPAAHGYSAGGIPRWISAIGCLKQSDLVVSGSNDGSVRLWRADVEARSLEQVASVPLEGFVNGLAVSSTGKFLVAAVGQEHRLGRWEHQKKARNEICVVPLPSGAEDEGAVAMDTESAEEDQGDIDGEEAA